MAHKPGTPPKADLPPYFNIDPAEAAEKLSAPIDTARFAKAAAFAMRGRDDLARRGYAPDGTKRLRKFSTWEVCRYLIPVNAAHLRRVLRQNPDLPQGEGESGSKWYTLEEVLRLRDHFAEEGAKERERLGRDLTEAEADRLASEIQRQLEIAMAWGDRGVDTNPDPC